MRLVIDTNVAISGLLWSGPPNTILKWARQGILTLIISEATINEFNRVITNKRFSERLQKLKASAQEIVAYYINISHFVPNPQNIPQVIAEDPFDNIFLALSVENNARLIITGDRHLFHVGKFQGIHIVKPTEACRIIEELLIRH